MQSSKCKDKNLVESPRKKQNLKEMRRNLGGYLSVYDLVPMGTDQEITMKICVIGDVGVGKTSIIHRYISGNFSSKYNVTVGADFGLKNVQYDKYTLLRLQLWDIAGIERAGLNTSVYYRYAVGALLVFDLSRKQTFDSVGKWLADLRGKAILQSGKDIPVILIGNKSDIADQDQITDLKEFCQKNKILNFYHTSAKENTNIDKAMEELIDRMIIDHYKPDDDSIDLRKVPEAKPTKSCCSK